MKLRLPVLLLLLIAAATTSKAQLLLQHDFNYAAGDSLIDNGWTQIQTVNANALKAVSPGLTYTGYPSSGIGNATFLTTSGQDAFVETASQVNSGSVYCSFMLKDSTVQTSGDYFLALLPSSSSTSYAARTFIRQSSAGYIRFGISRGTEAAVYTSDSFPTKTTYLCVVKYTFNANSLNNDSVRLYVFRSGFPSTEPASASTIATGGSSSDLANVSRVALRQNSPILTIDGLRLATTWTGLSATTVKPYPVTGFGMQLTDKISGLFRWTKPVDYVDSNSTILVFLKKNAAINQATPTYPASAYTPNSDFSLATSLYEHDSLAKNIYAGDSSSIYITGLAPYTTYLALIAVVRNSDTMYSSTINLTSVTVLQPQGIPGAIVFTATSPTSARLSWAKPSAYNNAAMNILVFAKATSAITTAPPDSNSNYFIPDTSFSGNGTKLPSDSLAKNVYKGDSTFVLVGGLNPGTTYHFVIYVVRDSDAIYSNPMSRSGTTPTSIASVTGLSSISTSANSSNIAWTKPGGYVDSTMSTLVLFKALTSITSGSPTAGLASYAADANFSGSGSVFQNDSSAKVVYIGDSGKVTVTGLSPSTLYHVSVFVVRDADSTYSIATSASGTTRALPPDSVSNITVTGLAPTTARINWTKPSGYTNNGFTTLVFVKQGSPVTAGTPTRTVSFYNNFSQNVTSVNNTRYQNDTAARILYKGDTNFVNITGMSNLNTYHVLIYVVRDADSTYSPGSTGSGTSGASLPLPPFYNIGQINKTNTTTGNPDSLNVRVEVRGVVYGMNQSITGGTQFLLKDYTGGITILNNTTFGYTVTEGDSVMAQGTVSSNRGLNIVTTLDTLKKISSASTLSTPTAVTALGESTDNDFISLTVPIRFVTRPTGNWPATTTNYPVITLNKDTVTLRHIGGTALSGTPFPATTWFYVTGIGSQLSLSTNAPFANNGYRIIPGKSADIVTFNPYGSFTLESPASSTTITAQTDPSQANYFAWYRSTLTIANDTVRYLFQLDTITGNFSAPRISQVTNNGGADTNINIPNSALAALTTARSVVYAAKWRVVASAAKWLPATRISDTVYNVNIIVGYFTGLVDENKNAVTVIAYPNPSQSSFEIKAGAVMNEVTITDITGRVIHRSSTATSNTTVMHEGWPKGIYFVRIKSDSGEAVLKMAIE